MTLALVVMLALATQVQKVDLAGSPCVIVPLSSSHLYPAPYGNSMTENCTLKTIDINSVAEYDTVVDFVSRVFHSRGLDCSEVIGVVGELDLKTVSIIHTLASRANLNITLVSAKAPSTFLPPTSLTLPNLIHMNPLTHYVEALAAFLDHLNWTRIGLISENTPYDQFIAELVQQKLLENPERRIIPFLCVSSRDNKTKVIQTFKAYETDVIFITASDSVMHLLMQEADKVRYTWPKYAWITFNSSPLPLEGLIFLTDQIVLEEEPTSCDNRETCCINSSRILMGSLSAVTQAYCNSVDYGEIRFRDGRRLNNISVVQVVRNSCVEIGFYDSESQQISDLNALFVSSSKPRGSILKLNFYYQYFTRLVSLIMVLSFLLVLFVSVVLVLYLYFHKEPEIKATSVAVSLSMFLGCYILILYMPLLVLTNEHRLCNFILWFSLGGLPLPLIVATLFFKVLRVYLIFFDPYSFKKKLFSDPCLFLYIMLLMTPSFLILTVWSAFDPYTFYELKSPHVNFELVHVQCASNYTAEWLATHLFYWIILCSVLVGFALKTAKIRYKHFKDTKATNAFIYLTLFFVLMAFIYWYFIYSLPEQNESTLLASDGVVYAAHGILVVVCQVLLFVPKVYPPLKRRLTQTRR